MIEYDSVDTMQRIFKLNESEAMEAANRFPGYLAQKLADKFVETHWEAISKDKKLMAAVKRLTELIEQQVSKALGIEPEKDEVIDE